MLTILEKGDLVGEFAVIDQQPRSASACAIGKCALLERVERHFSGIYENNQTRRCV
jgi:CRP-like cAMP-binding protein